MNTQTIELNSAPQYWFEGFPIGTGRLAAMIISNPGSDLLHLNHEALWTKLGVHKTCSDFTEFLPEFRRLLTEHKSDEATEFIVEHSKTQNGIEGPYGVNPFVPAGEIEIRYALPEQGQPFQRSLNLANGSADTRFSDLERSFWGNPEKDLLEGIISAEKPFSADLILSRKATDPANWGDTLPQFVVEDGMLKLSGSVAGGVYYCICVRLAGDFEAEPIENGLHLTNLKRLAFRCNIGRGDTPEDAEKEAFLPPFDLASFLADREKRDAAYRKTYDSFASVETPSGGEVVRYFNFAKHLLLNGTTTGCYPLNLQGKWNADPQPAWDSDYHMDINLQMNYWPVLSFGLEKANLDCMVFLERMKPGAREAAKRMFGCRGLWFPYTADPTFRPQGASVWGISAGCIPWLAAHYFQHYLYTQDLDFLRNHCFPFLREAILFFEDFITYRADGTACLSPSMSPENCFVGAQKYPVALCENSTMDVELVGELLTNGIAASEILGEDPEERSRWQKMKDALPPLKIGKDGRLLEWENEVEEVEPGHRHVSHLYAVWPGNAINREQTPELFEAARKSLDFRLRHGGGHTGWSRAWCANFKAMFGDGNGALDELKTQVKKQSSVSLLDLHPRARNEGGFVFQIDGNFGAASAVFNMLLQNAPDNGIRLLPALPDEWRGEGRVSGIRAVGALRFDFSWKDGKVVSLTIYAKNERKLRLMYNGQTHDLLLHPGCNPMPCRNTEDRKINMTDFDEQCLKNIRAPQSVGIPPINAGYDLMALPDGELRHYAGYCDNLDPLDFYLSSRDRGLSWKKMPIAKGCPGAMTYIPFAQKWIRLLHLNGEFIAFDAPSMDGPFRRRVLRPSNGNCVRLPIILQKKKNRLLTSGQENLPGEEKTRATVYYSDDAGETWKTVYFEPIPFYQPKEYDGGCRWDICGPEPTVTELSDGTLYMLIRTSQDFYYQSYSHDSGETWTTPEPSPFYGTATDPTLFKMKSGRLLFFGNLTRSMPEIARDHISYLSDAEKRGRWEDLFTNRDALHAAVSDDDGKTWHGFREIWLNPMRNDSNFRHLGGYHDNDRSVHQEQAVELPYGKILLALGQHPAIRKMIIFDPDWLLENEREDDFISGTDNWSTHLYLKGRLGGDRGPGTGHCCWNRQQGASMTFCEQYGMRDLLQIARYADPRLYEERQGAVWNFPLGQSGEIKIEFIPRTGMKGTLFMLMDHWANPGDTSANKQADWVFPLTADGTICGEPVKMDEVNTLQLFWNGADGSFSLNGGDRKNVPQSNSPLNGINYLHVQSSAETEDMQGIFLRYVKAVVR